MHAGEFTKTDLQTLAAATAARYEIDSAAFLATLQYESQWNPKARGDYDANGNPTSYGMCQFRFPVAHWGMTVAQADNPLYCMDRMAQAWKAGQQRKWTGYRLYINSL